MEKYKRKAVSDLLSNYCHLSKEYDFIELTAWGNGEGFDINISKENSEINIGITDGMLKAIKKLYKQLYKDQ